MEKCKECDVEGCGIVDWPCKHYLAEKNRIARETDVVMTEDSPASSDLKREPPKDIPIHFIFLKSKYWQLTGEIRKLMNKRDEIRQTLIDDWDFYI